jgi:uncharacterized protein
MPPTLMNGKICYVEILATAFDDTTGEVSGTWALGRSPASEPGFLVYVMVDSVAATLT